MTTQCKECFGYVTEEELDNCPFCEQADKMLISCPVCYGTYSIKHKDCPACVAKEIQGANIIIGENRKNLVIFCNEDLKDITTREEGNKFALYFMANRIGVDFSFHSMLCLICKYSTFNHLISVFLQDMEKAVIANTRNSEAQKLKYAKPFLEFAYAEGSLFEDIIFGTSKTEKEMDEIVRLDWSIDVDVEYSPRDYYRVIKSKDRPNSEILGRLLYAHSIAKPIFANYVEQGVDTFPTLTWEQIVKDTKSVITSNIYRK